MPAAPERDEGGEGLRGWLLICIGDIVTAVNNICRGCKGRRQRRESGGNVDAAHAPGRGGGLDRMPTSMANYDGRDGSK